MSPEERAHHAIHSEKSRPLSARVTAAIRSARAEAFREAERVEPTEVPCPECDARRGYACFGRWWQSSCAARWRAALRQRAEAEENQ